MRFKEGDRVKIQTTDTFNGLLGHVRGTEEGGYLVRLLCAENPGIEEFRCKTDLHFGWNELVDAGGPW